MKPGPTTEGGSSTTVPAGRELPPEHRTPPREPAPERREDDEVPRPEATLPHRAVEGEGDGGGGGVAAGHDVVHHLVVPQFEALLDHLRDPEIRLVGDRSEERRV